MIHGIERRGISCFARSTRSRTVAVIERLDPRSSRGVGVASTCARGKGAEEDQRDPEIAGGTIAPPCALAAMEGWVTLRARSGSELRRR
jgi:hypothetical protein